MKKLLRSLMAIAMVVTMLCGSTVALAAPTKIALNLTSWTIQVEDAKDIQEVKQLSVKSGDVAGWLSTNDQVATVKDGFVTAKALGTTTIIAYGGDAFATCKITVAGAALPKSNLKKVYFQNMDGKNISSDIVVKNDANFINIEHKIQLKADGINLIEASELATFATSNPNVAIQHEYDATTDALTLHLKGFGNTVITAKVRDRGIEKTATLKLTVKAENPVTGITLTHPTGAEGAPDAAVDKKVVLTKDKATYQLKATLKTKTGDPTVNTVVWNTSNNAVATVNDAGLVTFKSAGTVKITAAAMDGSGKVATASMTITVVDNADRVEIKDGDDVVIKEPVKTVRTAQSTDLVYTASAFKGEEKALISDVSWSNGSPKVVEMKVLPDGTINVMPLMAGTAKITAKAMDNSKKFAVLTIMVTDLLPISISPNMNEKYIDENGNWKLQAGMDALLGNVIFEPTGVCDQRLTYKSSNKAVAAVDADGKVSAIKAGTTIITVTGPEGTNKKPVSYTLGVTVVGRAVGEYTAVTKVEITETAFELIIGREKALTAVVTPDTASTKTVKFTSSQPTVAKVDAVTGKVTAVGEGSATITATAVADATMTAQVVVTVPAPIAVSSLTLTPEDISTEKPFVKTSIGDKFEIGVAVTPEDAANKDYIITSSDPKVVKVVGKMVTVLKIGTATLTVTAADGSKVTAKMEVHVIAKPVESVKLMDKEIEQEDFTLEINGSKLLTAVVAPANATNKAVTYVSDKPEIAKVDGTGKVTALTDGTAVITVSAAKNADDADDAVKVDTVTVKVYPKLLTIKLVQFESMTVGTTTTVKMYTSPQDANPIAKFTSSDPSIATVDEKTGEIKAIKVGQTSIKIVSLINPKLNDTMPLTVKLEEVPVTQLELDSREKFTIGVTGNTTTHEVLTIVIPENATYKSVKYKSADETIATVDKTGLVTAVGVGTTTITATSEGNPNKFVTMEITVVAKLNRPEVEAVTIEGSETFELAVGDKKALTASTQPSESDYRIIFTSSASNIATVDKNAVVTAVAVGTAVITATSKADDTKTASVTVTVVAPVVAVTGVTIDGDKNFELVVEATQQLTAKVTPNDATNQKVIFSSDKESVATVEESGLVTALTAGTAVITATSDADDTKTASVTVTVTEAEKPLVQATSISFTNEGITEKKLSVDLSETKIMLTAEVDTETTGDKTYTITAESGKEAVATLNSATSEVTLIGAGEIIFTVTANGNNVATDRLTLTVTEVVTPQSVEAEPKVEPTLENTPIVIPEPEVEVSEVEAPAPETEELPTVAGRNWLSLFI